MIEQICTLTTIHPLQYIFPTRYLYTYTLSAALHEIFLDKISEDDLRCSRPTNVYVIIIETRQFDGKAEDWQT
jgi:hypothetical protein